MGKGRHTERAAHVLAAGTAGGLGAEESETSGSSGVGRGGGIASPSPSIVNLHCP